MIQASWTNARKFSTCRSSRVTRRRELCSHAKSRSIFHRRQYRRSCRPAWVLFRRVDRSGALGAKAGELHARAAVLVVHPELSRSRGDDVLAVGRPDGRREVDPLTLGEDAGPGTVGVRDPRPDTRPNRQNTSLRLVNRQCREGGRSGVRCFVPAWGSYNIVA